MAQILIEHCRSLLGRGSYAIRVTINYGETTMSAYWIARAKINDPVQYKKYTDPIAPVLDVHGGRKLVRGGNYETLVGTKKYDKVADL